jgi:hypothetical protein
MGDQGDAVVKVIYIAGPYMGKTHDYRSYHEIERNIAAAREMAAELVWLGYGFFCPHTHSAHFEVIRPEASLDYWRRLDLRFLDVCDALITLSGWNESDGAREEVRRAREKKLPVFHDIGDLVRNFHD